MKKIKRAFTLIELMVVISIMIALIGMTFYGATVLMKKVRISNARSDLNAIHNAVKKFYSDTTRYPLDITEDILGKKISQYDVYKNISTHPEKLNTDPEYGPYLQFKSHNLKGDKLIDPWGNPYIYNMPEDTSNLEANSLAWHAANNGWPVIYSMGPDGKKNIESSIKDDIGSWQ
jgi:prepilin-type N-terminal cleavage/methylation domain-containing protein